jgi:hypothetical protein
VRIQLEVAYTMSMKALVALLLFPVAFLTLSAQQRTSDTGQNASPTNSDQQLQEPPVDVAPEPTDPVERALRATRNRLQNSRNPPPSSAGEGHSSTLPSARRSRFDTQPSGPPSDVIVDRAPFRPGTRREDFQLPVSESDTILLGSVSKVQPYLSEDGSSLYTEYTVSVEEVFKDSASLFPKKDSVIALFRMGGSLRLPSGAVVRTDVHGLGDPPVAGHRYVCFLRYDALGYWFRIDKLWELRNGAAAPMDPFDQALVQEGRSQFTGMDEAAFLNAVRDAVKRVGAPR